MEKLRIVAFAGSLRKESYNKKILEITAKKISSLDVGIKILDLNNYEMPIYNQDIEDKGMPLKTQEFKREIHSANAILISSPEYNGSFSGALKNAIDWASRKLDPNEATYEAFTNKGVGLISASPSGLGGIRGIMQLREVMTNLGSIVMPESVSIPSAFEISQDKISKLEAFAENYVNFCKRFT